jgi:hypothetical protein
LNVGSVSDHCKKKTLLEVLLPPPPTSAERLQVAFRSPRTPLTPLDDVDRAPAVCSNAAGARSERLQRR